MYVLTKVFAGYIDIILRHSFLVTCHVDSALLPRNIVT